VTRARDFPAQSKSRSGIGALVLAAAIAALYFTREILIPLAFALTLTFLLTPVVASLERLRLGRTFSVLAAMLGSIALAAGIGWIIVSQLIDVANQLPQYRLNIETKIAAFHVPVSGQLGKAAASVQEIVRELGEPPTPASSGLPHGASPMKSNGPSAAQPTPVQVVQTPNTGWEKLRDFGTAILAQLGLTGMVIIFTIFMLLKREDLRNRLLRLAGLSQLNLMTQALDDAANRVSRYLRLQFLVNAAFGILFGCGLYWIGVPYAALWGVVAGILRIVPYVGTPAASLLPVALSLAVFDGWAKPSMVFGLGCGLELVIANAVEPWLYAAHLGISSLALLVTSVFWAVLWGPAGLILSTPLTVCVVVLGRYVPHFSFLHIMLGDEPVLAAEAAIYQRLLAMDQQEAHAVVDEHLKGKELVDFYDSVLIPTLTMAEQDRHKGAIGAEREEFLFVSINEMIAEFSDYQLVAPPSEAGDVGEPPAETEVRSYARILCLPVSDRADEITASMLAQLLEQKGYATVCFSGSAANSHDVLAFIEAGHGDVVCISALPPYAFAPARAMCRQIRERFPKLKIVVCVCGFSGDTVKAKARFERAQPDRLATSLGQALVQVNELVDPHSDTGVPLVA
jgi:predicted PurR-regulated permease PerM